MTRDEGPTRRLHMTIQITPALVSDIAGILLQGGWEKDVEAATAHARMILDKVNEDLARNPVNANLPKPQAVKDTWVDGDPLKMGEQLCHAKVLGDGSILCERCRQGWERGVAFICPEAK